MKKINFKRELKELYTAKQEPKIVQIPIMNFIMIDGKGDPNSSLDFQEAINTLFPLAYTIKFMIKKGELEIDYGVLPLEGVWWADDMETSRNLFIRFSQGKAGKFKDDYSPTYQMSQL